MVFAVKSLTKHKIITVILSSQTYRYIIKTKQYNCNHILSNFAIQSVLYKAMF